jgi:hypothetical protein
MFPLFFSTTVCPTHKQISHHHAGLSEFKTKNNVDGLSCMYILEKFQETIRLVVRGEGGKFGGVMVLMCKFLFIWRDWIKSESV